MFRFGLDYIKDKLSSPVVEPPPRPARVIPEVILDPSRVKPQWMHPYLLRGGGSDRLSPKDLESLAYDYFLRFMTFFRGQPEGDLRPGIVIEYNGKMRQRLGMALLFDRKIKLNREYFCTRPVILPYTLFHEMVHIWLYDCDLDPGHTRRFYAKMLGFLDTGLPVDPEVHVHRRLAPEAKYVFRCPECTHRWYTRDKSTAKLYCGYCFENSAKRHYPVLIRSHETP